RGPLAVCGGQGLVRTIGRPVGRAGARRPAADVHRCRRLGRATRCGSHRPEAIGASLLQQLEVGLEGVPLRREMAVITVHLPGTHAGELGILERHPSIAGLLRVEVDEPVVSYLKPIGREARLPHAEVSPTKSALCHQLRSIARLRSSSARPFQVLVWSSFRRESSRPACSCRKPGNSAISPRASRCLNGAPKVTRVLPKVSSQESTCIGAHDPPFGVPSIRSRAPGRDIIRCHTPGCSSCITLASTPPIEWATICTGFPLLARAARALSTSPASRRAS